MPRGQKLNDIEKGKILAYHDDGKSNRQIAASLGRSPTVVDNFLKNPDAYGTTKRPGRPSKLSERDTRRIYRTASNSTKSCSEIKGELGLDVAAETVRRAIKKNPRLVRRRMKRAPMLKAVHRANRLQFARRNINSDWTRVGPFVGLLYGH